MKISYAKPVVNKDGTILVEQIAVMRTGELPNGIRKRELKVIQELYPDMATLKETMAKAKENYGNLELQGSKTVEQLEQEKQALAELMKHVDALK